MGRGREVVDFVRRDRRSVLNSTLSRLLIDSLIYVGTDMGYAFLEHLVGNKVATVIRGIVELPLRQQDEDEFAEFYKLV